MADAFHEILIGKYYRRKCKVCGEINLVHIKENCPSNQNDENISLLRRHEYGERMFQDGSYEYDGRTKLQDGTICEWKHILIFILRNYDDGVIK